MYVYIIYKASAPTTAATPAMTAGFVAIGAAFLDDAAALPLLLPAAADPALLWLPAAAAVVVAAAEPLPAAAILSRPAVMVMTFMLSLRFVLVRTVLPGDSRPGGMMVVQRAESWGVSSTQLAETVALHQLSR